MSNKAEDINTFIEKAFKHFEKNDIKKKGDLDSLKKTSLNDHECLYLYHLPDNKVLCKKGFFKCLGYNEDIITFSFLFKNIHPDDVKIVKRITTTAINYSLKHPKNSINNQLFITYRHKTADNNYIKILNQISIFDTNKEMKLTTLLIRLLDISFLDSQINVNWSFKTANLDEEAFRKRVYKYSQNVFTRRELELISEIVKGHTNKQIGVYLNISEHTVATHRKNILRKSGCHNFIELEIFCKEKGIL